MNSTAAKTAFLGEMTMPRLLAKLSIPAIIAVAADGLYNIIDTIFVGQYVGKYAIGALTVVYFFQLLRIALGIMIGFGAASIISRRLGAGSREGAGGAAGNALFVAMVSGAAITILVWLFSDAMLLLFGATPKIIGPAREYLRIVLLNSALLLPTICGFDLMRSEGRADQVMKLVLVGTAINIGMDAVLIAGLNMGVQGAALATVISQCIVTLLAARFYLAKKSALGLRWSHFIPDPPLIRRTLALGTPVFIRLAGGSLAMIVINNALGMYGGDKADLAISAYGVVVRVTTFAVAPLFGLMQGLQPAVGYNFGAGDMARVKKALKLASAASVIYGAGVLLAGAISPGFIVGLFSADPELVEIGSTALVLVLLAFPITGICMIGSAFFQALGKALPSLTLFILRQIGFLVPLAFLLPTFFGVVGAWAAIPSADLLAAAVTTLWLALELRKPIWSAGGAGAAGAADLGAPAPRQAAMVETE